MIWEDVYVYVKFVWIMLGINDIDFCVWLYLVEEVDFLVVCIVGWYMVVSYVDLELVLVVLLVGFEFEDELLIVFLWLCKVVCRYCVLVYMIVFFVIGGLYKMLGWLIKIVFGGEFVVLDDLVIGVVGDLLVILGVVIIVGECLVMVLGGLLVVVWLVDMIGVCLVWVLWWVGECGVLEVGVLFMLLFGGCLLVDEVVCV